MENLTEFQNEMATRADQWKKWDDELREFEKQHGYDRDQCQPDYAKLFQLAKTRS